MARGESLPPLPEFGGDLRQRSRLGASELQLAYDQIHSRGAMNAVAGYYEWLVSLLGPERGRLLDVGCGTGQLLAVAASHGFSVAGIDISAVAVDLVRKTVPTAELHVGVAESLPFPDSSFDAVCCIGSLEHVIDPLQVVREMRRVARPAARVLIVVPNSRYLMMPVIRLRQLLFPRLSQPVERHASEQEWRDLLRAGGLAVLSVHKDNNVYVPGRALQSVSRFLGRLVPLAVSYQLVLVARPQ